MHMIKHNALVNALTVRKKDIIAPSVTKTKAKTRQKRAGEEGQEAREEKIEEERKEAGNG